MMVVLQNPKTGDRKWLGVGWNWSFLLFSSCLGIPLFFKGLTVWGAIMMILCCLQILGAYGTTVQTGILELGPTVGIAALSIFLANKGNALVARKWLARGYDFAKPDSSEARDAMESWGL